MNILTVHNYYQHQGGEEGVFQSESELLEENGHQVWRYTLTNDRIGEMSSLSLLGKTLWNHQVYRELRSLIRQEQIQLAHFHNTFPLISPSAYYACKAEGIPVIQTCHNYRLLCANGMFLREGKVCEDCLDKLLPLPSIQHKCYRNSQIASIGTATMLTTHRLAKTWSHKVDKYIALTEFARQKLIQGGIPPQKIVVKPNFVNPDPGFGDGNGGYALFVGRLSQEKGIDLLLSAWEQIKDTIPLKIVGDGPLGDRVEAAASSQSGIDRVGRKSMKEVYTLMKGAAFLVFPSRWYEGFPRTIIESFAVGTPVIAANLGSMSTLITPKRTGLHFQAGNVEDLVAKVLWAINHLEEMTQLRQTTRAEFLEKYTTEENYRKLLKIYLQAVSVQSLKRKITS
jgi:glycosyltransferase involved in cell wall biosynthesis